VSELITDEAIERAARAAAAHALDRVGLGIPMYLCQGDDSDPHGDWDNPTTATYGVVRAALEAAAPLIAARVLREAADECEALHWGMGGHSDVWAIRGSWLSERADRIENERSRA